MANRNTRQGFRSPEDNTPTENEVVEGSAFEATDSRLPAETSNPLAEEEETPDAGPVGFDTVPGGGTNRTSGGRQAARAYVRPKTPLPRNTGPHDTVSIDVETSVGIESRAFPTAPSLQRRRSSENEIGSLPPIDYPERLRWSPALLVLFAVVTCALAFFFWQRNKGTPLAPPAATARPSTRSDWPFTPKVQEASPGPVSPVPAGAPSAVPVPPLAPQPKNHRALDRASDSKN